MAHKRRRQASHVHVKAPGEARLKAPGKARLKADTTVLALAIILGGAWAYSNSLNGVFVLDDLRAIVLNPTLSSVADSLSPPPQSTVSGRPIANLSFAISRAFGDGPRPFHITNIVIHLVAALLVFGVGRRTLLTWRLRDRFGEAAAPLAFSVALIWVVHPLTTAAVTYVVQRVESLMSLFYLLALYAAIRAIDARGSFWTIVAIVSCALGMATKEVMVTAPVAVAMWMWVFAPEALKSTRVLPGLGATWIVFAVLVYYEHRTPSIATSGDVVWRYLLTQTQVITRYLRLAFVPTKLVFLYSWPLAASITNVALPAILVVTLVGASVAALARRHPLGFAGTWFFLILAPTSSVIPIVTEVAADHRMYLPLVPLIAVVVTVCYAAATPMLRARSDPASRPSTWLRAVLRLSKDRIANPGYACVAFALVLATAASVETRARNRDYLTAEALWRDTITKDPANQRAHVGYGSALATAGRIPEAQKEFEAALAIDPSDPVVHGRLGHLYGLQRQDAAAAEHLQRALDLRPGDPVVTTELAGVLADSRDPAVRNPLRALPIAEEAVRLTGRQDPAALEVLAVTQAYLGHGSQAIAVMEEAVDAARRAGDPRVMELEQRLAFYRSRLSGR